MEKEPGVSHRHSNGQTFTASSIEEAGRLCPALRGELTESDVANLDELEDIDAWLATLNTDEVDNTPTPDVKRLEITPEDTSRVESSDDLRSIAGLVLVEIVAFVQNQEPRTFSAEVVQAVDSTKQVSEHSASSPKAETDSAIYSDALLPIAKNTKLVDTHDLIIATKLTHRDEQVVAAQTTPAQKDTPRPLPYATKPAVRIKPLVIPQYPKEVAKIDREQHVAVEKHGQDAEIHHLDIDAVPEETSMDIDTWDTFTSEDNYENQVGIDSMVTPDSPTIVSAPFALLPEPKEVVNVTSPVNFALVLLAEIPQTATPLPLELQETSAVVLAQLEEYITHTERQNEEILLARVSSALECLQIEDAFGEYAQQIKDTLVRAYDDERVLSKHSHEDILESLVSIIGLEAIDNFMFYILYMESTHEGIIGLSDDSSLSVINTGLHSLVGKIALAHSMPYEFELLTAA